eukprot:CAMPEP_0115027008 /NCGR_PEP_ID=MMETSP0216-20121206/35165_1 /TAXON_ID=223996 /ORGANISM="Protocruzia adherens, Strain Boccale" /LENGTH=117 /DNA_ID=CAMNT_0002402351 /DNA_START=1 /DNA_END=351 /DNA_ORIENTATION=-
MLVKWINQLGLMKSMTADQIPNVCKDGLLLCKLLEYYNPGTKFSGLYPKALAKTTCMSNIEKALTFLCKANISFKAIPTAEEVYEGKGDRVWLVINTIFEAYAMTRGRSIMKEVMQW